MISPQKTISLVDLVVNDTGIIVVGQVDALLNLFRRVGNRLIMSDDVMFKTNYPQWHVPTFHLVMKRRYMSLKGVGSQLGCMFYFVRTLRDYEYFDICEPVRLFCFCCKGYLNS